MRLLLKRKLLVSMLVSLNMAFIFCAFVLSDMEQQSLMTVIINFGIGIITVTIVFLLIIAPIALIFSSLIEIKIQQIKYGKIYSFFLHILIGIIVGTFISLYIMQDVLYTNTLQISYWIYYSLYPSVCFYIMDTFYKHKR